MANYNFSHQDESWSETVVFGVNIEIPWSLLAQLEIFARAEEDSVENLVIEGISRAVSDRNFGADFYGVENSDELTAMRRLRAEHERSKRGIERVTGSSVRIEPVEYSKYKDLIQ